MKIIKISNDDFETIKYLYNDFYKIYGDENTIWSFDDLDEMRKMGQEFMEIFSSHIIEK
jgi:hypothetical protein